MQLHKLSEDNLFGTLSDKEQEVVSGGTTFSGPWGTVNYVEGPNGSFQYTAPNGQAAPLAKWTTNSFSYGGKTYTW